MPTPKFPFCYAIKSGDSVTLYVLVYVPSGQSASFGVGSVVGQTMLFNISITGTANGSIVTPKEAHVYTAFSVTSPTIDTIEVKTLESGTTIKTMKLLIADLDVVVSGTLGLPSTNRTDIALDTPYVCTKNIDKDNFKAEVVIITDTAVAYTEAHTDPPSTDKNTLSKIEIGGNGTPTKEITTDHIFNVADFGTLLDNDAYTALYKPGTGNPPPIRQNKTKNKNHTPTAFPRPRPKKK